LTLRPTTFAPPEAPPLAVHQATTVYSSPEMVSSCLFFPASLVNSETGLPRKVPVELVRWRFFSPSDVCSLFLNVFSLLLTDPPTIIFSPPSSVVLKAVTMLSILLCRTPSPAKPPSTWEASSRPPPPSQPRAPRPRFIWGPFSTKTFPPFLLAGFLPLKSES